MDLGENEAFFNLYFDFHCVKVAGFLVLGIGEEKSLVL